MRAVSGPAGGARRRPARLEAAADGAVTAVGDGYAATLRACLRQFDALASALWAVHEAGTVPPPQPKIPAG